MKISWAVFKVDYISGCYEDIILKLKKPGFKTEREAKKYVQHPDNQLQGSFVVLEVIEMSGKTKAGEK